MREERPDASLFIGLHKLAQQNGDGLVPELYDLLTTRRPDAGENDNVVAFPTSATVSPTTVPLAEAGRVLPFRR